MEEIVELNLDDVVDNATKRAYSDTQLLRMNGT